MATREAFDRVALLRQARELQAHRGVADAQLSIVDAQSLLARGLGFESWPRLRAHVDAVARWTGNPERPQVTGPADEVLRDGCVTFTPADDALPWEAAAERLAAHPELAGESVHLAAAAGDLGAVQRHLAADPRAGTRRGGPFGWEPLLYLAYSRLGGGLPVKVARALLFAGADPNAGYLLDGAPPPFTALTGVLGGVGPSRPMHPTWRALADVLLVAGADPNDERALYHRQDDPDDEPLALLLRRGLGRGGPAVWARRLGAHSTPTGWSARSAGPIGIGLLDEQIAIAERRGWTVRVVRLQVARLRVLAS